MVGNPKTRCLGHRMDHQVQSLEPNLLFQIQDFLLFRMVMASLSSTRLHQKYAKFRAKIVAQWRLLIPNRERTYVIRQINHPLQLSRASAIHTSTESFGSAVKVSLTSLTTSAVHIRRTHLASHCWLPVNGVSSVWAGSFKYILSVSVFERCLSTNPGMRLSSLGRGSPKSLVIACVKQVQRLSPILFPPYQYQISRKMISISPIPPMLIPSALMQPTTQSGSS